MPKQGLKPNTGQYCDALTKRTSKKNTFKDVKGTSK